MLQIYHNSRCTKSRKCLAFLEKTGKEYEVVKYLEAIPSFPELEAIIKKLGIKPGETTADGRFSIKTVECLAACGNAPVIQVGTEYHENVTSEKADQLLSKWTAENKCSHTNPYQ